MKNSSRTTIARTPDLSEAEIEFATAHGLEPIECPSCAGRGTGCANCGGSGRLWHAPSGISLDDAGLRRLADRDAVEDEPRPLPPRKPKP